MRQSRRRFVLSSAMAGSALIAGCVSSEPDDDSDENDDSDEGDDPDCDKRSLPLVDTPPHGPEQPPSPDPGEEDEWNDHYLGEGIEDSPTTEFEQLNLRPLAGGLNPTDHDGGSAYEVTLITSREAFDDTVEPVGTESEQRADAIDFETEAVLFVRSGFGSSSVRHEWVRVESHCNELHLHGYYVQPHIRTSDYGPRSSGLVVERPDADDFDLDGAWVSLTTDEDTRVNVHSDDGVQVVNGETDGDEGGDSDSDSESDELPDTETVPATHGGSGDWWSDGEGPIGIAVHLEDESEVRTLVDDHENVDRFIEGTDFETDSIFFIETAAPNLCYQEIDVSNIITVERDDTFVVRGDARAVDNSNGGMCAPAISHPAVLLRVESEVDASTGSFDLTDGWGTEETVESRSLAEFQSE